MTAPSCEELRAQLAKVEAQVAELRAALNDTPEAKSTRRQLLRGAAGAAAGGAAVLLTGARPAAAATGGPLLMGRQDNVADQTTVLRWNGAGMTAENQTNIFLVNDSSEALAPAAYPAAVAGWAQRTGAGLAHVPHGVTGYATLGYGVVGWANTFDTPFADSREFAGVYGVNTGHSRYGVLGESKSPGSGVGVAGVSTASGGASGTGNGIGVYGDARGNGGTGVEGVGGDVGVRGTITVGNTTDPAKSVAVLGDNFGVGVAVQGVANMGIGVEGTTNSADSYGVSGKGPGTGVRGEATGTGVGVTGTGTIGMRGVGINGPGIVGLTEGFADVEPQGVRSGVLGVGEDTGVFGDTTNGRGVYGRTTGGRGVSGESIAGGVGVHGLSQTGPGVQGVTATPAPGTGGVFGQVTNAASSEQTYGVHGKHAGNGVGVLGQVAGETGYALVGQALADGGRDLFLTGSGVMRQRPRPDAGPPTSTFRPFYSGDSIRDTTGDLYICTGDGSPGVWRKVTASAPGFHNTSGSINFLPRPIRVLDTRGPDGNGAKMQRHQNFAIPLSPRTVGGVTIPDGAKGVFGTVTVTETVTSGHLTLFPTGGPPPPGVVTSNINWFGTNQTLAASFACGLNPVTGELSIENGIGGTNSNATHVVLDIAAFVF